MNWSEERWVKLYTRQTATWRMWPWESRCVLPLLVQASDRAGVIDVGSKDPLTALAVLLMVPRDFAERGISGLLADGTVEELAGRGFRLPNYVEAQQARTSPRIRKETQRDREMAEPPDITEPHVTAGHSTSQPVTNRGEERRGEETRTEEIKTPAAAPPINGGKKKKADPPPKNPLHAPLVKVLCEVFERIRGSAYPFKPRDAAAVRDLLATGTDPQEIANGWARALRHSGYPTVSTLHELYTNLSHFIGAGAPEPGRIDINQGIIRHPQDIKREDPFPWKRPEPS